MDVNDKPYHHGGLRAALVSAALDALEQGGPGALSLRGLAKAVGVSPMAPYHHFADRNALLAAVAAAGFERLQAGKAMALAAAMTSPEQGLIMGSVAYVEFVLAHPQLYRLMKGAEFADSADYPDLKAAAAAPVESLLGMLARLAAEHPGLALDLGRCAQMLWALSHGAGILALDGQIERTAAAALVEDGARTLIAGWLHPRWQASSGR